MKEEIIMTQDGKTFRGMVEYAELTKCGNEYIVCTRHHDKPGLRTYVYRTFRRPNAVRAYTIRCNEILA